MKKSGKTKEQLLNELTELRQRIAELEAMENTYKKAKEALLENEGKYRSLIESTDDSIYMVDRNYRYLFMNKKCLSRVGVSEEQIAGKTYGDFHSPEETEKFIEKVKAVFETGESVQHEYQNHGDGKYFFRTLSPVKVSDSKIIAVSIISKNITELKHLEEELLQLSLTDELTGLYNRRGFLTLAEQQLKMAKRLKIETFMLYADMDNLKGINDSFGHKEGDFALIGAAKILKATCRDSDIVARIGGDEFAVFPVGTTEAFAEKITLRLQKNLEIHNAKENRGYNLSLSIGITCCDVETDFSIHDLLVQADKLMYEQKRQKSVAR
jgi:diguanylate cyclase (GGDEF)-like protein/PAS domain S-box-containing protein